MLAYPVICIYNKPFRVRGIGIYPDSSDSENSLPYRLFSLDVLVFYDSSLVSYLA